MLRLMYIGGKPFWVEKPLLQRVKHSLPSPAQPSSIENGVSDAYSSPGGDLSPDPSASTALVSSSRRSSSARSNWRRIRSLRNHLAIRFAASAVLMISGARNY